MQQSHHFPTFTDQPYFCFPESVGHYKDYSAHYVRREAGALNNYNIHLIVGGRGYVEVDGQIHTLQRGDAILYFPLQEQIYYSSQDDPWDVIWVHYYGDNLREYLIQHGFHRSPLWTLRQTAAWEQAHSRLLEEAEAYKLLHLAALSTLTYALIAEFVSQAVPLSTGITSNTPGRIEALLPLMQKEACQPFSLEEWAERAGVSSYYFCKLFRKSVLMSPLDFITLCRLQVSKQWLLERKHTPIREIAMDAGYPSVSYFNRRFLQQEGITPTEYRKLYERGN